jgi:predicted enzyme related to lactoylglutathione lyase
MPNIDKTPTGRPIWIDTAVATAQQREDLAGFFSGLFGWTWDMGTEETGFYSIASKDGRPVMGIGQGEGGEGQLCLYFASDDIDADVKRATELGATVGFGPMKVMDAGSMAIIHDPTGAMHGFWQPDQFPGFGVIHEPGSLGWCDHTSKDPDAAGEYYAAITGATYHHPEPDFRVLTAGDEWFASLSPDDGQGNQWSPIFIATSSLADARDKAVSQGATVVFEEQPVPGSAISLFIEPVMNRPITVMRAGEAPA